jgi:regulator of replication initiation timing
MDVENESLSSRLDRIEYSIRAQKKELDKAKHYMPSLRQELANDYIDGFEVPKFPMTGILRFFQDIKQNHLPSTLGNIQDNECDD